MLKYKYNGLFDKIALLRAKGCTRREISTILDIPTGSLTIYLAEMICKKQVSCISKSEAIIRQRKSRGYIKPTIQNVNKAKRLLKQGKNRSEIAETVRIAPHHLGKAFGAVRKEKARKTREKTIKLYRQGLSYKEIAEYLDTTESCIGVRIWRLKKDGKLQ